MTYQSRLAFGKKGLGFGMLKSTSQVPKNGLAFGNLGLAFGKLTI